MWSQHMTAPPPRGNPPPNMERTNDMLEFLVLLFIIAVFAAEVMAISLFIKVGMAKGYSMANRGVLWFIGLMAPLGPIVIGLYVSALPDRAVPDAPKQASELPPLGGASTAAPAPKPDAATGLPVPPTPADAPAGDAETPSL